MRYYATLGPACCEASALAALLRRGVSGFRLNVSHTMLAARRDWIDALHDAERSTGLAAQLMIDLRGPEVRIGALPSPLTLTAGEAVTLGADIPVEKDVLAALVPGMTVLLDDGAMALTVLDGGRCRVTRGGVLTGHKSLMGPQGTGGLCVGEGIEIRPFAVGGTGVQSYSETQPESYPTRLEAGTLNSHGIAGLGASLAFLERTGWDRVRAHEGALARRFYETVKTIPGVKVYGNFTVQDRAPIVSLNIADLDSSEVADELAERFSIATRPGAHCAPRLHRALGTTDQGAVRFSWSYFNTEEETDAAAEAVRTLAAEAT